MTYRKKGEKGRYDFLDAKCIGRDCWAPGEYQHRGATSGGSRDTGRYSLCCMTRAYHGCPFPLPEPDPAFAKEGKDAGWSTT